MTSQNVLVFVSGLWYQCKLEGNIFPQIFYFQHPIAVYYLNDQLFKLGCCSPFICIRTRTYFLCYCQMNWSAMHSLMWYDASRCINISMFQMCQCVSAWKHRTNLPRDTDHQVIRQLTHSKVTSCPFSPEFFLPQWCGSVTTALSLSAAGA